MDQLIPALISLRYKIHGVKKDSDNPFHKSKYADLEACQEAVRELLYEHNMCIVQTSRVMESGLGVLITTLYHASGQWIRSELPIVYTKGEKVNEAQAQGSAITYARRYALCAITGLYQTDDDGEGASGRREEKQKPTSNPYRSPQQQIAAKRIDYKKAAESMRPLPQQPPLQRPSKQIIEGEEEEPAKPFTELSREQQVTKEMMGELLTAAKANGWNGSQVQAWILTTYGLEESTLKYTFTREYWEATKKWVAERKPEDN